MAEASPGLSLFVIYRPTTSDYPGRWVLRKQTADRGMVAADPWPLAVGESLEQIRAALPPGLTCLGRSPLDDPVIEEVWI